MPKIVVLTEDLARKLKRRMNQQVRGSGGIEVRQTDDVLSIALRTTGNAVRGGGGDISGVIPVRVKRAGGAGTQDDPLTFDVYPLTGPMTTDPDTRIVAGLMTDLPYMAGLVYIFNPQHTDGTAGYGTIYQAGTQWVLMVYGETPEDTECQLPPL